jgi:hypothetical protein
LSGCDFKVTPAEAISKAVASPQAPKVEFQPVVQPADLIGSDFVLRKSSSVPLTGDLRPIYIISGRIGNTSHFTVTKLRILVSVYARSKEAVNEKLDSAFVDIDMEIPPGEAQSFARSFHIQPPSGKWNWDYYTEAIAAK